MLIAPAEFSVPPHSPNARLLRRSSSQIHLGPPPVNETNLLAFLSALPLLLRCHPRAQVQRRAHGPACAGVVEQRCRELLQLRKRAARKGPSAFSLVPQRSRRGSLSARSAAMRARRAAEQDAAAEWGRQAQREQQPAALDADAKARSAASGGGPTVVMLGGARSRRGSGGSVDGNGNGDGGGSAEAAAANSSPVDAAVAAASPAAPPALSSVQRRGKLGALTEDMTGALVVSAPPPSLCP